MRHLIAAPVLTALMAVPLGVTGMVPAAPGAEAAVVDRPGTPPAATTGFTLLRSRGGMSNKTGLGQATLTCEPAGGTHPRAARACQDLLRTEGSFEHPAGRTLCPLVYSPVTVRAVGLWRGSTKRFEATYGNACIMRSRTGAVFGF